MNDTHHDPAARLIGSARRPVPAAVRAVALPIVEDLGLRLVGVELATEGSRSILWVYIDRESPDGAADGAEVGVTIDDCARVSPELSAALDVEDPIPHAYELRVSSPGLDRPLMSATDFEQRVGQTAAIQLADPLDGRRNFTGELLGLEGAPGDPDEAVRIRCSDGEHDVPLASIHKARIKYELPMGQKRSHGKKKKH